MDVLLTLLRASLSSFKILSDADIAQIIQISTVRDFDKGEVVDAQGVKAENVYLILSGLMRCYYTTSEGKEFNQAFKLENEFIAAYASLLKKSESMVGVDCLEPTKALVIPFDKLEALYSESLAFCQIGRKIAEQHFLNKEKREADFLLYGAKERYLKFKSERPDLVERVPQLHLASFLGLTPTSFNRILKELK